VLTHGNDDILWEYVFKPILEALGICMPKELKDD